MRYIKKGMIISSGQNIMTIFYWGFTGCMHVVSNNSLRISVLPDNFNNGHMNTR